MSLVLLVLIVGTALAGGYSWLNQRNSDTQSPGSAGASTKTRPAPKRVSGTLRADPEKRNDSPVARRWLPRVELQTAGPVIWGLANVPGQADADVRLAICRFVSLSEGLPPERAIHLMGTEPDVVHRPWVWLTAAMRAADAADDPALAAAGLYWATYWTSILAPRLALADFLDLGIDPIPVHLKTEIVEIGVAATEKLPPEQVIVGDDSGQILAGMLASTAARMMGI